MTSSSPLLSVRDLTATFGMKHETPFTAVDGLSFDVHPGQTVGLVGESGCGKSVTSLAIMGLLPGRGNKVTGTVTYDGQDLLSLSDKHMGAKRGKEISMIFQDPLSSLNPVVPIGRQVTEVLERHQGLSRKAATPRARDMLEKVGIPDPQRRLVEYPHQLSGGMRQRALIAMALACEPRVLIADEPTTALDVTIQAQILALLRELVEDTGTALIMITHDLGVVAGLCDEINVLYGGGSSSGRSGTPSSPSPATPTPADSSRACRPSRVSVAAGSTRSPDRSPTTCRGRAPARSPRGAPTPSTAAGSPPPTCRSNPTTGPATTEPTDTKTPDDILVDVHDLKVHFPITKGIIFDKVVGHVYAVDGVDLQSKRGETYGLVGESGCGKSTLGRAILHLEPPTSGTVTFDGEPISTLKGEALRTRRQGLQMVFQDPMGSLDPRQSVEALLVEGMKAHGLAKNAKEAAPRLKQLLADVGLPMAALKKYPHEFSGGQRQRIGIARALSVNPELIVADEPVSALDVSVQAQVINLLADLQDEYGLTYLVIAHDLAVVRHISDRVGVMYLGGLVEEADADDLYAAPLHPYTRALLSAVPVPDPVPDPVVEDARQQILLSGDLPSPANPPSGCRFHTRCPWRQETRCETERPELRIIEIDGAVTGHRVACHWAEQIESGEITVHDVGANIDEAATALADQAEEERVLDDLPFA